MKGIYTPLTLTMMNLEPLTKLLEYIHLLRLFPSLLILHRTLQPTERTTGSIIQHTMLVLDPDNFGSLIIIPVNLVISGFLKMESAALDL